MRSLARISFEGGGLFLPVRTPYEREVLFEHVDRYTKRHGRVCVEINRCAWNVTLSSGEPERCAACTRALDQLTYALGARSLCMTCARRELR